MRDARKMVSGVSIFFYGGRRFCVVFRVNQFSVALTRKGGRGGVRLLHKQRDFSCFVLIWLFFGLPQLV